MSDFDGTDYEGIAGLSNQTCAELHGLSAGSLVLLKRCVDGELQKRVASQQADLDEVKAAIAAGKPKRAPRSDTGKSRKAKAAPVDAAPVPVSS